MVNTFSLQSVKVLWEPTIFHWSIYLWFSNIFFTFGFEQTNQIIIQNRKKFTLDRCKNMKKNRIKKSWKVINLIFSLIQCPWYIYCVAFTTRVHHWLYYNILYVDMPCALRTGAKYFFIKTLKSGSSNVLEIL